MTELRTDNGISFLITGYGERDMTDQSQSAREMVELADKLEKRLFKDRHGNIDTELGVFINSALVDEIFKAMMALRTAAQAALGEPVAWLYESWNGGDSWGKHFTFDEPQGNKWQRNIVPLYATLTALPQDGRDPATIEALESVAMQAVVQQAIMKHPHYETTMGPVTAYGFAGVALKAIRAALSSKGK